MKANKIRVAVGIDFGGTRLKMGLVDEAGRILDQAQYPTSAAHPPDRFHGAMRLSPDQTLRWHLKVR